MHRSVSQPQGHPRRQRHPSQEQTSKKRPIRTPQSSVQSLPPKPAAAGPTDPGSSLELFRAAGDVPVWGQGDLPIRGSAWHVMPGVPILLAGHDFLSGVAGSGPDDVWAVGRIFRHPVP